MKKYSTTMFIEALFMIWLIYGTNLKCQLVDEWIEKMWKYNSAIKKDGNPTICGDIDKL